MITKITAWFAAQGGIYHVLAGIVLFLTTGYDVVPAFHTFCNTVWGDIPSGAKSAAAAIAGLYVLYSTSHFSVNMKSMKATVKAAHLEVMDARQTVSQVMAKSANPVTPVKKG